MKGQLARGEGEHPHHRKVEGGCLGRESKGNREERSSGTIWKNANRERNGKEDT